jgi:hypothetical protein
MTSHPAPVQILATVTSVNDHSSCCVFLGVLSRDDSRSVRVVQFRRSEDEALADRAAELNADTVISLSVDRCTVGTTRLVGRGLTVVECPPDAAYPHVG